MAEETGIKEENGEKAVDILRELEELAARNGLGKDVFKEFVKLNFGTVDTVEKLEEVKKYVKENIDGVRRLCGLIKEINKIASVDSRVLEVLNTVKPSVENLDKLDEEFKNYLKNMTVEIECDVKALKMFVNCIEVLVDEALIECTPEGIKTKVVDPANVAMVIAELTPEFITGQGMFGLPVGDLNNYLKFVPTKSECKITIKHEVMTVDITPEDENDNPMTFKIRLIDPTAVRRSPKVPDIDWTARMTVRNFNKIIKLLETTTGNVIFEVNEDGGSIAAIEDESEIRVEVRDCDGEGKAMYAVDYLREFAKIFAKCGDTVGVRFSTNYPAEFSYEGDDVRIAYILAPRFEA